MTIFEFFDGIPDFARFSYVEQIKRFCWHVAVQRHQRRFKGAQIATCFERGRAAKALLNRSVSGVACARNSRS